MVVKDNAAKRKDTVCTELKITGKHKHGLCFADLVKLYCRVSSTICIILKKKEDFKKLDVAKGVTMITKKHPELTDAELLFNKKQLKR